VRRAIQRILVAVCIILTASTSSGLSEEKTREIRIGVRAHTGTDRAMAKWQPTADYLTQSIPGYHFTLVPYEINSALNQAVSRNEFEFVLTNPASYIEMEKRYGAYRLLTLINKRNGKGYTKFGSVIFTLKRRTDITRLQDLKGKTFMGSDELGFGGWRAAWLELLHNGIDPYRDFSMLSFGGGIQQNVVRAVLNGQVDAGCVRTDMLEEMADANEIQLNDFKVLGIRQSPDFHFIHSTQLYPEWPFAKLAHTDDRLAEDVATALRHITPDHPAAIAGDYIGWHTPLDYQPVDDLLHELGIGPYATNESMHVITFMEKNWHITFSSILIIAFFAFMLLRMKILNTQLRLTEHNLLQSNQKLKDMTVIDGLTGVGNRRKLDEFLQHNWGRVCRVGAPVCVMLLDIDYFKDYNDTYGHLAGDDCLKKIADTINKMFRRTGELVIRYGGEEFLIMVIHCDLEETYQQAEILRNEVEQLNISHSTSKAGDVVTVSIGIASFIPDKDSTAEELIMMADQALYKAKHAGRNRVTSIG